MSTFQKILAGFGPRHNTHEVFRAFVRLAACALAAQTREPEYLEEAKRWTREDLERFAHALGALIQDMEQEPFRDLLGPAYMETLSASGQRCGGEFHTPPEVAEVIARMLAGDRPTPAEGPITLSEPACGSGAMILAYAAALPRKDIRRLRVVAVDINATACDMCFINTSLWGIPATVIHGNSLTLKCWAQWRNIHELLPFLAHLIPAAGSPADCPTVGHSDTAAPAAPAAAAADLPAQVRTAAAALQGQPPTEAETAALGAALEQLAFQFAATVDEPQAPYAA